MRLALAVALLAAGFGMGWWAKQTKIEIRTESPKPSYIENTAVEFDVGSRLPAFIVKQLGDSYELWGNTKEWTISCITVDNNTGTMRPNYEDAECWKKEEKAHATH